MSIYSTVATPITFVNSINGFSTTSTSGGTLTLTTLSNRSQYFTGILSHTVVLPVATTLVAGQEYYIRNNSAAVVTVNTSGGDLLSSIAAGDGVVVTCTNPAGGTGAASWSKLPLFTTPVTGLIITQQTSGEYFPTFVAASTTGTQTFNVSPNFSVISGTSGGIGIGTSAINIGTVGNVPTSTGTDGICIGNGASSLSNNCITIGEGATSGQFGSFATAVGNTSRARDAGTTAVGAHADTNSIPGAVVISGMSPSVITPIDTAHALAFGINATSINPGSIGVSVNNVIRQLPLYPHLYETTATSGVTGVKTLSATTAKDQFFTGTLAHNVALPAPAELNNAGNTLGGGYKLCVYNRSTQNITVGSNAITTLRVGVTLPAGTIIVRTAASAQFAAAGTLYIRTTANGFQSVNYTSKKVGDTTANGTQGLPPAGGLFNVTSAANLAASGVVAVLTTFNGEQFVSYTSIIGNQLQGCTGGTGSVPDTASVLQGSFYGCTGGTGTAPVGSEVGMFVGTIVPATTVEYTLVDQTGATGVNGWNLLPLGGSPVVMDNIATGSLYPIAPQTEGVWYGSGAKAKAITSTTNTFIGNNIASSTGFTSNTVIGYTASSGFASGATAIGVNARAIGNDSFAGGISSISSQFSTSVGPSASCSGQYSFAGGIGASAGASYAIAIGSGAALISDGAISIGNSSVANSFACVSLGNYAGSGGVGGLSIAVGNHAGASAVQAIGMGNYAAAAGANSIAIGANCVTATTDSIVIGSGARAHTGGISIGASAARVCLGASNVVVGINGLAVNVRGCYNVAVGSQTMPLAGAGIYTVGTVSQTGNTITGVGTTFTVSMVGGTLVYVNNVRALITAFVSSTVLTVAESMTVSSRTYTIYYGTVYSAGTATQPGGTIITGTGTAFTDIMTGGYMVYAGFTYTVGTASQTGTTITGVGTTFISGMVNGYIVFADGTIASGIAFVNATTLIVTPSQTVAAQSYTIYYNIGSITYITQFTSPTQLNSSGNVSVAGSAFKLYYSGAGCTVVGYQACENSTGGVTNTTYGYRAGRTLTNGGGNVLIGAECDVNIGLRSDSVAIGRGVIATVDGGLFLSHRATSGATTVAGFIAGTNELVETSSPIGGVSSTNYAAAFDTTAQSITLADTWYDVTFDTNGDIDGWIHTASTADFTCAQTGKYNIIATITLEKTAANVESGMRMVLGPSGGPFVEVAYSLQHYHMHTSATDHVVAILDMLVSITAMQVLKVQIACDTAATVSTSPGAGFWATQPSARIKIIRTL